MSETMEFRHRISEEDAGYTCIPNAVLLDPRIAPMTRLCYSIIKSYAYGHKDDARPGQKALAQQLGVKERMVRNYLTELEILGLITIEQRGLGKTNIYWIEPLTGLEERIPKYLEWLQDKKPSKRQPIASPDRQPIASQDGQSIATPVGNPLPTKNTSIKNNKVSKHKSPQANKAAIKRARNHVFDLVMLRSFTSDPRKANCVELYKGRTNGIIGALNAAFPDDPNLVRDLRRAYRKHARTHDENGNLLHPCQSKVAVVELVKRWRRDVVNLTWLGSNGKQAAKTRIERINYPDGSYLEVEVEA